MKKPYWLLAYVFFLSCIPKKNDDKTLLYLLLYSYLTAPKIDFVCEDIPPNQPRVDVTLSKEACNVIQDPLYNSQWHLTTIKMGSVWQEYCGTGVTVGIIDDGVEIAHEDLQANIRRDLSYDYVDGDNDPTGDLQKDHSLHGTAVAGTIAARDNNLGVRGVAPRAGIYGLNPLITGLSSNIIDAMQRNIQAVWVMNNSWGPRDGTGLLTPSLKVWQNSVTYGLKEGRNGLGTIYLLAAGNGAYISQNNNAYPADNSNYDGYANFYGVMAICAAGRDEKKANYSEEGANLWICAPSMGNDNFGIVTTDIRGGLGLNDKYKQNYPNGDLQDRNYTQNFNGTSAATPIVSGAVALLLQANPKLTWRDVRYILAKTAKKNDSADSDWKKNAAGFNINHKYGFGLLQVEDAIRLAKDWKNLGNLKKCTVRNLNVEKNIPDDGTPIISEVDTSPLGIRKIEWVDIKVDITHSYWGDLFIKSYSPSGTDAVLMVPHYCSNGDTNNPQLTGCNTGRIVWRFGIARYLDETATGTFRLEVRDKIPDDTGTFSSWEITIYGREN